MQSIIVVGGGLAGLSAAHTALERGANVVLIDKSSFLGGNSTKATSGINGALTQTQIDAKVGDSVKQFIDDTLKSARDLARPEMINVLCGESGPAVEWLQKSFALDLSILGRLGGHSFPRTHRGKERFPGMTITYALMERYEDLCQKEPTRCKLFVKSRVTRLIGDARDGVRGVVFETADGKVHELHGVVILATGGYGADFSSDSLLAKHRPDLLHLPTTNGPHCTGDGIKMAEAIGAGLADIKSVQVHPTGLIDPQEPDAKVKFLAAEALRGTGALLLDARGKRFVNELGHRDFVSDQMMKNQGPFRLLLNGKAAQSILWHCKHYMGRGLMQHAANGNALAALMKIDAAALAQTFADYNQAAAAKKDPFGKQFFDNAPFLMNEEFYVAFVTPVVHYTMGGLNCGPDASVRTPQNAPIAGLYCTGEVMGGVHGANRLGGSSLLDCVVFGRVAGASATRTLLQRTLTNGGGAVGGAAGQRATIEVLPGDGRIRIDIALSGAASPTSTTAPTVAAPTVAKVAAAAKSTAAAPAPAAAAKAVGAPTTTSAAASAVAAPKSASASGGARKLRTDITMEEVKRHNKKDDCWIVVNGQVLDATPFLNDHPGGAKAILMYAGKDASEEFNMLHKPDVIARYAPEIVLGPLAAAKGKL